LREYDHYKDLKRFRSIIAMAICRNQPRAHEGQMVSGEKGGNCSALWLCVGIVERWWNPGGLTGIKPQSQESARRTNERRRLSRSNCVGFSRMDGKECWVVYLL